ncbi:dual specificity protein phosphatase 13A [Lepisosteus oculatus]|uniref:dual specificity protein phosphatase 13A n=1 Tax=Lepisosteus oculatus TaxID=7918 RepID=UPI00371DEBB5
MAGTSSRSAGTEKQMASSGEWRNGLLCVRDLENILDTCKLELTQVDEVWPNLYIGNVAIAQDRKALQKMGVTHILNAAHSKQGSIGDQAFYGEKIQYFGIPADDSPDFDLSVYFKPTACFIHKALKKTDGKVLVHCIMGMSRSASLVLAYLMLHQRLSLSEAIQHIIQKRAIYPNRNFLKQLGDLDLQLSRKRRICPIL